MAMINSDPRASLGEAQPAMVTLLNGAEADAGEVIATMGILKHLQAGGASGQTLLRTLYGICCGSKVHRADDDLVRALISDDLLAQDGHPSETVKNIVLSAVVENTESSSLELQAPYPDSDKNDAAFSHVVRWAVKELGLEDIIGRPRTPRPGR